MADKVPPIPPIVSADLLGAVSCLVRAAATYRSVLFKVVSDHRETFDTMIEHEEVLHLCDLVINGWRKQLDQDIEDEQDDLA